MKTRRWRRSSVCLAVGMTVYGMTAATQAPAGSLYVEVAGAAVTVQAEAVSTRQVLEELAQQSGLKLVLLTPLDAPVTVKFEQRLLPDAIKSILHRQNFALQYTQLPSESGEAGQRPNTLWVLPGTVAGVQDESEPVITATVSEPEKMVAAAEHSLSDGDIAGRIQAVLAMADLEGEQATLALAPALVDADAVIREEAAAALGKAGGRDALELLGYALNDVDRDVRATAIESIAEIGGDEAASTLALALNDSDDRIRIEAVDALGEMGGATAATLLRQALADEDSDVREIAAGYLTTLSSPVQ